MLARRAQKNPGRRGAWVLKENFGKKQAGRAVSRRCSPASCRSHTARAGVLRRDPRQGPQRVGLSVCCGSARSGCSPASWHGPGCVQSMEGSRGAPGRRGSTAGRRFRGKWTRCRRARTDRSQSDVRAQEKKSGGAQHHPCRAARSATKLRQAEDFADQIDDFHGHSWRDGTELRLPGLSLFLPP